MENAFAVARSKEKTCGICMEVVMDKPKGEARFGILPNCNHCFCLSCLRTWRQAKQFEHKIIRYNKAYQLGNTSSRTITEVKQR